MFVCVPKFARVHFRLVFLAVFVCLFCLLMLVFVQGGSFCYEHVHSFVRPTRAVVSSITNHLSHPQEITPETNPNLEPLSD